METVVDPFAVDVTPAATSSDPLEGQEAEQRRILDNISVYLTRMEVLKAGETPCFVGFAQQYKKNGFKTAVVVRRNHQVKDKEADHAYETMMVEVGKDTPIDQVPLDGPAVRVGSMKYATNSNGPYLHGSFLNGWGFLQKSKDGTKYHMRVNYNTQRQTQTTQRVDAEIPF